MYTRLHSFLTLLDDGSSHAPFSCKNRSFQVRTRSIEMHNICKCRLHCSENRALMKTKGRTGNLAIDMKTSSCPNLVKFSITTAAKCSEASPCTNHPMHCPYCPKSSPVVWSYTFCQHLLRFHPSIPLDKHRSVWTLSKLEKDRMKQVWENRLSSQRCVQGCNAHHL